MPVVDHLDILDQPHDTMAVVTNNVGIGKFMSHDLRIGGGNTGTFENACGQIDELWMLENRHGNLGGKDVMPIAGDRCESVCGRL